MAKLGKHFNKCNDRRVKHGKPISGVKRYYIYSGHEGIVVYGKTRIQAQYRAFGIVGGELMQVKRLENAIRFQEFDVKNANSFISLCEKMLPDYQFELREYVII